MPRGSISGKAIVRFLFHAPIGARAPTGALTESDRAEEVSATDSNLYRWGNVLANAQRLTGSVLGGLTGALLGLGTGLALVEAGIAEGWKPWLVLGASLTGLLLGPVVTALILVSFMQRTAKRMEAVRPGVVLSGVVGALAGVLLSVSLVYILSVGSLPYPWDKVTPALLVTTLGSLGAWVSAIRISRLAWPVARERIDGTSATMASMNGQANGRCILVDTSAIIDGRIAEITHTGFVDGELLIPRFVLEELQFVADSPDSLKRNRGRRGLDVLNRLQKDNNIGVQISDVDVPDQDGVDSKLVSLAKRSDYSLLTTDFNLNKVAELQGIKVLNINDLANSLKPTLIPGEELNLHITQEGKEDSQGVGFLDDGTMVVVEGGIRYLNSQLPVVITRVLQTSAGRIIFAHLK